MSTTTKPVYRLTLFKIPSSTDQDKLLAMYKEMPQKAIKDDKPYIISVTAGKTEDDSRRQNYTISVVTQFASMEDFVFYDTKCKAHGELKAFAKSVHEGNLMCFFEPGY